MLLPCPAFDSRARGFSPMLHGVDLRRAPVLDASHAITNSVPLTFLYSKVRHHIASCSVWL